MKKIALFLLLLINFSSNSQSLQSFLTISTRSELRSYSTIQSNRVVAAIGISSPWDAPTEIWTFDSSSMAIDDGVTVLKPNDVLSTDPGRYLFRTYFVKQYGSKYSKEWNGSLTVSGNTAVFDISSAGFTSIAGLQAFAILPTGTVLNLPITAGSVTPSNTSVTINLIESKTTNTLLISSAEGLENHAVAGTVVYLNVKGN